ncbi:MAG: hypothetical protein V4687_09980 [Bacteroidota bacterium]
MNNFQNRNPIDKKCRKFLYIIVSLLVFEGFLRKLVPPLNIPLFFLKDILCIWAMYLVSDIKYKNVFQINLLWKQIALAFLPLLLYTAFLDPVLVVFGAKQYLLYVVVAIVVPVAFPAHRLEEFKNFFGYAAVLVIPTSMVAILQNFLPATHWLNLSVDGSSLADFSAGGYLRVSSTFSFTGQYSFFLIASCAFFAIRLYIPPININSQFKIIKRALPLILGTMLVIGAFITGGRTAVLGCGACIFIGVCLLIYKNPKFIINGVVGVGFLATIYLVGREIKPEYFAAYETRSADSGDESQTDKISGRLADGMFNWLDWYGDQDIASIFLGNGLGVMANGSQKISSYAERVRSDGFWTESDAPTTAWEGGAYLLVIWYSFRVYIILFTFKLWTSLRNNKFRSAGAFIFGFILINGIIGTLSLQPPLAIWWWLMVGTMIALRGFDLDYQQKSLENKL